MRNDLTQDAYMGLTALRLALLRHSYHPVPVTSPTASTSSKANPGKAVLLRNWPKVCADATEAEIRAWAKDHPDWTNTGILTGDIVGIDIDITDAPMATRIEALAGEMLGQTPLRRVGRAPKSLLVYRASMPFKKLATEEHFFADGSKAQVEVLGQGQQFVGFGIHPATDQEYQWTDGSPLDIPSKALPSVTSEQVDAFLQAAAKCLSDAGAIARSVMDRRERSGRQAAGFGVGEPPTEERIAEALHCIPNTDLGYDEWLRIGFALYDGLGEAGIDLWRQWSAQSAKDDPAQTQRTWESFGCPHTRPITVATLFFLAAENGWRRVPIPGPAENAADNDTPKSHNNASKLIALTEQWTLFHDPDGIAYADVEVGGNRQTWSVRGDGFKSLLCRTFYQTTGGAVATEALNSALAVIEAQAQHDGPEHQVFVRVGERDGSVYLDLGTPDWRAVEIDKTGWRIVLRPPVRFKRASGMLPLPSPLAGGDIQVLHRLINIGSHSDFVLAVAWLTAALCPRGPYPLLAISGEQGSAKSTFARIMRRLIDPNTAALRSWPREERDLYVATANSHVLAYDNVSKISPWLSDALCRIATGGAYAIRRNYSDRDEELFEAQRPIILNGIADVVDRPDLAERAIFIRLNPISEAERRTEKELWAEVDAAAPVILGALLNGVVAGLQHQDTITLDGHPRMADFAHWSCACEGAFWPEAKFMAAYRGNRADAERDSFEADIIAVAVKDLMETVESWSGTATDLLTQLTAQVEEKVRHDPNWPKSPRSIASSLRRAATLLRRHGINVTEERIGKARTRTITITRSQRSAETPSAASAGSATTLRTVESSPSTGTLGRTQYRKADANEHSANDVCVRPQPQKPAEADEADEADDTYQKAPPPAWEMSL